MLKKQIIYIPLFAVLLIMLEFAQAGNYQPGEGCTESSQCTEGYKCILNRELNYYRCAEESNPTPAPSGNTPQEPAKDKAPNLFDTVYASIAQFFSTPKG
ncbi:hypothetical protein BKA57DRAFT_71198 [Linnemannia elongata]|nr:hypothetical protein BKA57DRAFT_71198 [Linnemannia elongata]